MLARSIGLDEFSFPVKIYTKIAPVALRNRDNTPEIKTARRTFLTLSSYSQKDF